MLGYCCNRSPPPIHNNGLVDGHCMVRCSVLVITFLTRGLWSLGLQASSTQLAFQAKSVRRGGRCSFVLTAAIASATLGGCGSCSSKGQRQYLHQAMLLIPSCLDKADRYRNRITRYAHGKPWHIMAFPRAMPARRISVRTVNHTVPTASEGSSLFKPGSLPVTRHAYSTPSPSISTFLHSFSTYRRGEWFKPCGRPTRPTLEKSQGS